MNTIDQLDIAPWLTEFLRGLVDTTVSTAPTGTILPTLSFHVSPSSHSGASLQIQQNQEVPSQVNSSLSNGRTVRRIANVPLPRDSQKLQLQYAHAVATAVDLRVKVAELESHLGDHIEQISLTYEELAFLRRIAEHIQFCHVDQNVDTVAQAILPTLRDIVQAESLSFIQAVSGGETFRLGALNGKTYPVIWLCGWLRETYASFHDRPIIENYVRLSGLEEGSRDIRQCLLIPVASQGNCYGWLLAINKLSMPEREGRIIAAERFTKSESEFGTSEATLMSCVATTLATHACNRAMFREKEVLLINIIRTLVNTLDARDPYTCGHSERVALMASRIGRELEWSTEECEQIYLTGLLHDIGKIGVPDEVLRKPGRLTDEEFAQIKQHPEIGYRILKDLKQLEFVLPGVLHHHERMDGKGYPHQLRGNQIPLAARILAVVDSFDAMTSHRPYRRGMPYPKAEGILKGDRGEQWDPEILGVFLRLRNEMQELCRENAVQRKLGQKWEYKRDEAMLASPQ